MTSWESWWLGWRWWAVEGRNGTDELRLVGPFTGAVWEPGRVFVGREATSYAADAGVYALVDTPRPPAIDGWRANFPHDLGAHRRIVVGRVQLFGRLRSRGGQSIGDRAEVVSLDAVVTGSVDLYRLRKLYVA